jgi:hypothetical protein
VLAAAVLGVLTQVLDLRDRLFGEEVPVVGRDGAITSVEIDRLNASRHDYCRAELGGDALDACVEEPDGIGTVYAVGIRLEGYEGRCCHIDWKLVEVENGQPPSSFFEKTYSGVPDVTVRNERRDLGTYRIFVPNPARSGNFAVAFTLADSETDIDTQKAPIIRIP